MESLVRSLKAIRPWQLAVVAVMVLGTGLSIYVGYIYLTGPAAEVLDDDYQLIPVRRGDLVNDVSVNGSLVYSIRESLRFSTQGTVENLLVEEGEQVETGQILAKLDMETEARLEKAIIQAQIDLRSAEEALEEAKNPHSDLVWARAEKEVASARVSLRNTQSSLDQVLRPTDLELAKAKANEANARMAVTDAEEVLDRLLNPTNLALATAEYEVSKAKLAVSNAEETLDQLLNPTDFALAQARSDVAIADSNAKDAENALNNLKTPSILEIVLAESSVVAAEITFEASQTRMESMLAGPTEEELAEAQRAVDTATKDLSNARDDLESELIHHQERIQEEQNTVDLAEKVYAGIFDKWLGIDIGKSYTNAPEDLLSYYEVDIDVIFDRNLERDSTRAFKRGLFDDDPDTAWDEIVVYAWLALSPINILATCEDDIMRRRSLCVQKEMDEGWE